jgi:hypothetical protein
MNSQAPSSTSYGVFRRIFMRSSEIRERQDWAESPTGSRLHCQTGYDRGLVSEARRSEIRQLEENADYVMPAPMPIFSA